MCVATPRSSVRRAAVPTDTARVEPVIAQAWHAGRSQRTDPQIERIITEQIERFLLKKEKPRFSAWMERIHDGRLGGRLWCKRGDAT
ncbi:hypothetical protein SAMN05444161_8598 [Rhizobiales bacterium GAS191]|nr:hypothetical protein SAMN05444161_8598 [Rhizobiales bacterium GAS191]